MPDIAMEEPQLELRSLGRGIFDMFKVLAERPWNANKDSNVPSKRRVSAEEERFRLWARSLGLNQDGHASLDYRVRDASVIRASLADLLTELKDHLENLASILLGDRLPLERDIKAHRLSEAAPSVTASSDDETSLSSLSSVGSFQEAGFRLASMTTRLDALYKFAARIRSPRSRPQRPTKDLYKHVPESQRAEYIQNQEQIEVSLVTYVQRQQLLECVTDEELQGLSFNQEQLLQEYAAAEHWLIRRTGIANARRKQQFVYWRKHAELLGRDMTEVPPPVIPKEPAEAAIQLQMPTTDSRNLVPSASIATSATKIETNIIGLDDTKSVITSHSRVSTTVGSKGNDLAWPPAPTDLSSNKYFSCPYCSILCPAEYLSHDEWRIHQIHDLQPYHCTYEDCTDPNRLYGLRREWIDHENQHRRVWHCHVHEEEFETQPDYMRHLHDKRLEHKLEDSSTEMVAAVVGASSKPHRDCPFCPTAFSDVATMQRHIRYHLERLALYALPDIAEEGGELTSGQSSDSHQVVENRGRQGSVTHDFSEEKQSFLEIFDRSVDDKQELQQPTVTTEDIKEFAARLELLKVPIAMSDVGSIIQWITDSRQTEPGTVIGNIVSSSRPESGSSGNANRVANTVEPLEESKETHLVLGEEHPDTLTSVSNLAKVLSLEEEKLLEITNEVAMKYVVDIKWSTWHSWDYYRKKNPGGVAGKPDPPVSAETIWRETRPFGSDIDIAIQTTKALRAQLSSKPELSRYVESVRTLARATSATNPDLMHCITALSEETFCIVIDFSCDYKAMYIGLNSSVDSMPYHNMYGKEWVDQLSYRKQRDGKNVIERMPKKPEAQPLNVTKFIEYPEAVLIEEISVRLALALEEPPDSPGTKVPTTKTVKYKSYLVSKPLYGIPNAKFKGRYFATTCRVKIEFAHRRIRMQVPLGDWLALPAQSDLYREAEQANVFELVNESVRNLVIELECPRYLSPVKEKIAILSKIGKEHGMDPNDFDRMIDSIYEVRDRPSGSDCPG